MAACCSLTHALYAVAEALTVTTLAQTAQHARARVIVPVAMVGAPAPLADELLLPTSKVKAVQVGRPFKPCDQGV